MQKKMSQDLLQQEGARILFKSRSNPLVGYGVVTGLNGTGDSKSEIANQTFKNIQSKLCLNLTKEIDSKKYRRCISYSKTP